MASETKAQAQPFIKWAQDKKVIWLEVQITDAKNVMVETFVDKVIYSSTGFRVELPLHGTIIPEKCTWRDASRCVEIILQKTGAGSFWEDLLQKDARKGMKSRLQIDWDRWRGENDEADGADDDALLESGGKSMVPDEYEEEKEDEEEEEHEHEGHEHEPKEEASTEATAKENEASAVIA